MPGPDGMPAPGGFEAMPSSTALLAMSQNTRHLRRLYVGSVPPECTDVEMKDFLNVKMHEYKLETMAGDPVTVVSVHPERNFAFLEFRSPEECTNCLALDGITWKGTIMRIRRPKDFVPVPGFRLDPPVINLSFAGVPASVAIEAASNKIFIGNLPDILDEPQVR